MNKVMLIGYVGLEPEVRYYEVDSCVARVRLATTEKGYVLPNGTRVPDRTDWHTLVFYRKLAKVVDSYIHKGDKLYVEGRLQYSQYDDKRGIQRTATEIIVDSLEMLTPKNAPQRQMPAVPQSGGGAAQSADTQTRSAGVTGQQADNGSRQNANGKENENVCPF